MRDPAQDGESTDRRRALFRACSRVLFAAADPHTELTVPSSATRPPTILYPTASAGDLSADPLSHLHPVLVIAAMPQGCVPDLVLPTTLEDHSASEEFATLLLRSLGAQLLERSYVYFAGEAESTTDPSPQPSAASPRRLIVRLDGTLPYQLPGERLARRLSLRVSATASGPWLIFVYSVAASSAAQREVESRISIGPADVSASSSLPPMRQRP